LIAFCAERSPWFAVPRYVEVLEDLPRNEHGKVRKRLLRDAGNTERTWDRVAARMQVKSAH